MTLEDVVKNVPKDSLLKPVEFLEAFRGGKRVRCICKCGNTTDIYIHSLCRSRQRSCGCQKNVNRPNRLSLNQIKKRIPKDSRLSPVKIVEGTKNGSRLVECLCKCGSVRVYKLRSIINHPGGTKSCGCLNLEKFTKRVRKYKLYNKTIYNCYSSMMNRCYNEKSVSYKMYGAKGVRVCALWRKSYSHFHKWAINNGWAPGLQLDKDIKGNGRFYSPAKCSFVSCKENQNNRCNTPKYEYKGMLMTATQIAEMNSISPQVIHRAVRKGIFDFDLVIKNRKNNKRWN